MMVAEITIISEALGNFSTVFPNLCLCQEFSYSFEIGATIVWRF
jgi:hypothetical protein